MKVVSKKVKDNKVVLDIEVSKEKVKKKYDEVYEKISHEAKIPGFRPGKAPRSVLEQHHSKLAQEEVIKGLVTESYESSVKNEDIDVIDMPQITEVKFEGDILTYKAEVEVKPEIKIKQYKGLKLKKSEVKIEQSEIDEYLKQLKQARTPDMADERLAKSLGYKTKEEFLDCVKKQMYLKKENEERAKLEREIINQLLKNSPFVAPQTLVAKRAHELEHQAQNQMIQYGIPEDKIKQRLEEFKPKFKPEAEEQVKIFLILETIAKLENIKSGEQMPSQVLEFLFAEADWA